MARLRKGARRMAQGAEAELRLVDWMGRKAVAKRRVPKPYRLPELDRALRQSRTRLEARLLRLSRLAGVPAPLVYDVDLADDSCTLTMEFIAGEQAKRLLNRLPLPAARRLSRQIGEAVGRLHTGGIVHGDLTTSNMLLSGGTLYFIDFGLGAATGELEAQGVDLRVLKEAFGSTHAHIGRCFDDMMAGYRAAYRSGAEAERRLREIEGRGRYSDQVEG
ncbi:MAG: Kae1-associated serine/threonine protein kinase [Euryarchaeota archaeon]|nr:Kae1-associated serine/threonine protein kinase [Euryarchaeota archaeon]